MNPKPILFVDFDGTICHDRFWRSLNAGLYEKIQQFLFRENKEMVNDWMRGKHTSEDVNAVIADHIGVSFEELWTLFRKDCETMSIPTSILEKLKSLRDRFHVVLMTDNMDCFDRFTIPALDLQSYFDAIHNSCNTGKFKNDNQGEVFIEYAKQYSVPLRDAILIDNSPSACAVFSNLGGTAHLVCEKEGTEYHLTKI